MAAEQKWLRDALTVQDACNLSGVVHSFSRILSEMCEHGLDTDGRATHPASVLFSSKIADLTRVEADGVFHKAYTDALERTKGDDHEQS